MVDEYVEDGTAPRQSWSGSPTVTRWVILGVCRACGGVKYLDVVGCPRAWGARRKRPILVAERLSSVKLSTYSLLVKWQVSLISLRCNFRSTGVHPPPQFSTRDLTQIQTRDKHEHFATSSHKQIRVGDLDPIRTDSLISIPYSKSP